MEMWGRKKKEKEKDKDKIVREIIEGSKKKGFIFPPFLEDVYSIADWMADFTDGERRPYCRELRLVLEPSDWCKFQEQPFYQELIQYLNTVKTQKQEQALDKQQNLQGDKES